MAQGEVGEFGESLSFYHLAARIIHPNAKNTNANFTNANFLPISLSYLGIDLACEVPGQPPAPAAYCGWPQCAIQPEYGSPPGWSTSDDSGRPRFRLFH